MMDTKELIQILRDPDNPNVLDYIDDAADRLEQQAETIDYARTIQAEGVWLTAELEKVKQERDAMAAYLKSCGCDTCKHEHCDVDAEPCESCMKGKNFPAWEWKGE